MPIRPLSHPIGCGGLNGGAKRFAVWRILKFLTVESCNLSLSMKD